jgi:leader peptidase (prepilin peptidase) / N-methyltransferase
VNWLLAFYALAIGAVVGSFLNVVIHRWPREESIVFPGSHCPRCNAPIRWFDNVPVLSWIVLRGRCRSCREPIAVRYPLVELANALFYLAVYQRTGPTVGFLPIAALVSMTLVLIWIDLDVQFLPDVVTYPGMAIGLAAGALALGDRIPELTLSHSLLDSVSGAVAGGGVLLAIHLAYKLLRGGEGMGLGDVKMLAMIGAVVGWEPLFGVLMLASIGGAVAGILLAIFTRATLRNALPFGVFLGLALLVVVFFGPTLLGWYERLLFAPA